MTRCMDHPQGTGWIAFQPENIPIPEVLCAVHGHIAMAITGQVQMRIGEIDFSGLMDIDRNIRFLPDRRNAADMIEMSMGQQNFLYDPAIITA